MVKRIAMVLGALASFAALAQPGGKEVYDVYCSSCHGAQAKGDGWMARYLVRPVPALNTLSRQYGGGFPVELVRHVVDGRRQVELHGPREMPVWGYVFQAEYQQKSAPPGSDEATASERITQLIEYLKEIQE
jgi:mono/diheme cytochrome c family protein